MRGHLVNYVNSENFLVRGGTCKKQAASVELNSYSSIGKEEPRNHPNQTRVCESSVYIGVYSSTVTDT